MELYEREGETVSTLQESTLPDTAPETALVDYVVLGTHDVAWGEDVEAFALRSALIFGLIQLASVFVFGWSTDMLPLFGEPGSVGGRALISSVILSLIVSPIAYLRGIRYRNAHKPAGASERFPWDAIPVTIAVTLLVALLVVGGFQIFSTPFAEVQLDRASAATILVILVGSLAYLISRHLMLARTAELLVTLSVTYLFATLFFSTYFNDNPLWWQKSFSYLGMTQSNSRYIFNLGLMFTGLLVVIWQFYFMESFTLLRQRGVITQRVHTLIRWALILAGILLACVGIVRFGIGPLFNVIHDLSATGMGVILGVLMLSLRRIVPGYRQDFYVISIAVVLLMVLSAILKVAGHFNLVGLELAAFALAGLWLILFYRNTELLVARTVEEHLNTAAPSTLDAGE